MSQIQIPGIRAVVFDLDDTLFSEREFAFSGFRAVSAWLQQRVACTTDPEAIMRRLFDSPYRDQVFDQILKELGGEYSADLVSQMVDCFRQHSPMIGLHPDAISAIDRWAGHFRMGIVSDGILSVQQRKVKALGLESRIDLIILTDQWGREFWKPHPRAFREIEKTWQVFGPACLYIADNPRKDFIAPVQLGWRTVQIHRLEGIYCQEESAEGGKPQFLISSLDQIDLTS